MRIAAVDLVSNTCFPALAADELGFFKGEGLDVQIELDLNSGHNSPCSGKTRTSCTRIAMVCYSNGRPWNWRAF